eukprot:3638483-Alexandrium_andersonii.AAC.1
MAQGDYAQPARHPPASGNPVWPVGPGDRSCMSAVATHVPASAKEHQGVRRLRPACAEMRA